MITRIQQSKLFKSVIFTLILAFTNFSLLATPFSNELTLPDNTSTLELFSQISHDLQLGDKVLLRAGTPIIIETTSRFYSKQLNVGQSVNLRVKYDVMVGSQMVIPAGSVAYGKVSSVRKPKAFGKGGSIEIQVENVMAVDGQVIPISGMPCYAEGKNKRGLAITVAVVGGMFYFLPGLLSLLVKGKNAEIVAGTNISGNIAASREINLAEAP